MRLILRLFSVAAFLSLPSLVSAQPVITGKDVTVSWYHPGLDVKDQPERLGNFDVRLYRPDAVLGGPNAKDKPLWMELTPASKCAKPKATDPEINCTYTFDAIPRGSTWLVCGRSMKLGTARKRRSSPSS